MANNEHANILKNGVQAWNEWRHQNPNIKPDLSNYDLHGCDLSGIDFSFVNLSSCNLSETDFTEANFERANVKNGYLEGCSLGEACLDFADLESADLVRSFMIYSSLRGANLRRADLSMAILSSAILDGAILDETQLYDTQISRWSIKNVNCTGVYWDSEGKVLTKYFPGEFEKLHGNIIKVSIKYSSGFSEFHYMTLPLLLKYINERHPKNPIELKSINTIPGRCTEAVLVVYETNGRDPDDLQRELEDLSKLIPQIQNKLLQKTRDISLLTGKYNQLNEDFSKMLKAFSNELGTKYIVSGGSQGVVGDKGSADNFEQGSVNLPQRLEGINIGLLSRDLGKLLIAMHGLPSHKEAIAREIAAAQLAAQDGNKQKIIDHLKMAGKWALEFSKTLGLEIAAAAIKKSLGYN